MFGRGIVSEEVHGFNVEVDGRKATISASIPETSEYKGEIHTNPVDLLRGGALPSLSIVRFAKVKNFIDGVYAAVEERISESNHGLSRTRLLDKLSDIVEGEARAYILSSMAGNSLEPSIRVPQAFYDWNDNLRLAYRQIKSIASSPSSRAGMRLDRKFDNKVIEELMGEIKKSRGLKETYDGLVEFYSKMTGPMIVRNGMFPTAELPDQEFFRKLSEETQSDIEEGLGKVLIKAVKAGRVSFVPEENSGLYLRQMHEITPLILQDTDEFGKYKPNKKYSEILENEFVSQWAGTRHTHVGHTDFSRMMIGSSGVERKIVISPSLCVEPFSTSYERMRESIEFLERTLEKYVPEVLDRKRLMNDGGRAKETIGAEIEDVKLLLRGLGCLSKDSLHMEYDSKGNEGAVKRAKDWFKNIGDDADVNRNVAIFVPIIRTTDGQRQVSYINAGFKNEEVRVSYRDFPEVRISGKEDKKTPLFARYEFKSRNYSLPFLVHREVRIPYEKMINDRRLREVLNNSFNESELDRVVEELENGGIWSA